MPSELNVNAMICRNCGAGLEADRIDTSLGVVTCSHCGSLHDIPGDSGAVASGDIASSEPKPRAVKPVRKEVDLPRRFKVRRTPGSMEITWSAGGPVHGLALCIIAGGIGYMALTTGILPFLIASAVFFYFAAVRTINTHRIRVDKARLRVTQGPLPWPGKRKLDTSDITQLYATEHETRSDHSRNDSQQNKVRKHYRLSANRRSGGHIKILSGLNDPLQALWLEQEIERLLGITDQPVAGEHTP